MTDIKQVKQELLSTFNNVEPAPDRVAANSPLDLALAQYFNKASHLPREMTFEAVLNGLAAEKPEKPVDRKQVRDILDRHS
jgi:hypothetical protein